ncbi:metabotropic gamma-aminobutyric acid receptor [Elysia marginata]|uniref:Metabotropic gamma-aminobutyric acid receptor n=1 Tax=Elysia marginata TaxID=1093978 RepID=A0AAV4I2K0_9GAST|nr:metabotropic gamma-aminobutyric acid receptor [Elysia marginata]
MRGIFSTSHQQPDSGGVYVVPGLYCLAWLRWQIRAWLLSLGFTLSYGSMFSKIWTVHQMTTSRKKNRTGIQVWELYVVLAILVVLDVGVLTAWQILDPLQRRLETFSRIQPTNTDDDIELRPQLELCHSDNITVWLGVVFGYKGILLIFGIFLAYETRSVKLKQVNDSRFVGMSIYNVVVLCVITAPISLIISNQENATFAFVSLAILLCSFLSMGLIFVPKIKEILQNPRRDGQEIKSLTDSLVSREEEERHQKMLGENEQLKKQIAEMEERMRELNHKLQEKTKNLRGTTSIPTPTTAVSISTGPVTTTTATRMHAVAAAAATTEGGSGGTDSIFSSAHQTQNLSTVNIAHPHWEGSPIKHPELNAVGNKSMIAVELHSPTSSGASQEHPPSLPAQLTNSGEANPVLTDGETNGVAVLDPEEQCFVPEEEIDRKGFIRDGDLSPTSPLKHRVISASNATA